MVMSKKSAPAIAGPDTETRSPWFGRRDYAARKSRRRKPLEQAVLEHRLGAAEAFLGRLEDEVHGAVEIARLGQIARGAEQHGGVAVMAAAVKPAGFGERQRQSAVLFHRQRVHVGAQPDRALALEDADHAGAAEPAMHLDAPLRQLVGDDAGGADLLKTDLGMGVQIAPDSGEFFGIAVDAFDGGHVVIRLRRLNEIWLAA